MAAASASTRAFGANVLSTAEKNSAAFNSVGMGAAAMGAAMLGGFAIAANAAIDFESSFAGVRKTVDASESEFAALAAGIREMATEIPVSVHELNRIAEAAGQLGIEKSSILDFTRTMADLGVTTNLSAEQAATSLARLANIMQMPQSEFQRLGSTIVHLGNNLETTEAEITEFGTRIAGAGKIAGLTEHQILAIGGALSSVGIQAEAGGTAVQKVLLSITESVTTSSDKLKLFAATAGMSAKEFAAAWRDNAAQAFLAFVEGLSASGDGAIGILKELGLNNERTRTAFLSLAGAGDVLRESLDLGAVAWAQNTALTKEAEQRYETTAAKIQVAKNQINDAAISFGEVMLPAISSVVGVIGDLAEGFGRLPAPVRTAAMAFAAVGGAILVVGGGMLLLIPRLAAVKTGMATLGWTARGVTTALGPIGVALAVASVFMGKFGEANRKAIESVSDFEAALRASGGAIDDFVREAVALQLESSGALAAAESLGIGFDTLVDAVLGGSDAIETVRGSLDTLRHIDPDDIVMSDQIELVSETVETLGKNFAEAKVSVDRTAQAAGEASGPIGAMGDVVGDLGEEMEDTRTDAEKLIDALRELAGTALGLDKANIAFKNSLASLRDEIKDNAKTLDINTQAGRDNRSAIQASIDAAFDQATAMVENGASTEKATKKLIERIGVVKDEAVAAGLSEAAVRDYIRQLNLTPKDIKTLIEAKVEKALSDVNRIQAALDRIPDTIPVHIAISQTKIPQTQLSGVGGARRKHSGGFAQSTGSFGIGGLRADEFPTILQRGEMVLPRDSMRAFPNSPSPSINRMLRALDRLSSRFDSLSSKLQDRLGKLIDNLAEDHKEDAKELRELKREFSRQAKSLAREGEQIAKAFEKLKDRIADFSDGISSGFGSIKGLGFLGDLTDPRDISGALIDQTAKAGRFASVLTSLAGMGLNAATLSELAAGGLGSLDLLEGIAKGGESLIRQLNLFESSMKGLEQQTTANLETKFFGEELRRAKDELKEFKAEVRAFNQTVQTEIKAFKKALDAEGIDKVVQKVIRSLDKLADGAKARSFAAASAGTSARAMGTTTIVRQRDVHIHGPVLDWNNFQRQVAESIEYGDIIVDDAIDHSITRATVRRTG